MIFYSSYNNSVYDNIIAFNNNVGIYFKGCSQNKFFRNDIFENNDQTFCWYCSNIWDNGNEGNYWSDYNGKATNGEGIGEETSKILTLQLTGQEYDVDKFPLIEPTIIPEFPSWTPLLITLVAVIALVVICKRKLLNRNGSEQ